MIAEDLLSLINEKQSQTQALLEKCDILIDGKRIDGAGKFKRKVQAELDFLQRLKVSPGSKLRLDQVKSTNLTHLEAVCEIALREIDIVGVLTPFQRFDQTNSSLLVDVVTERGATWIKVVARSPKGLHIAWAGDAGYQERSIIEQAKDYVTTASKNPFLYQCPKIVFYFYAGVTRPIVDDLKTKFEIESRGKVVDVDERWCVGILRGAEDESDSAGGGLEEDDEEGHQVARSVEETDDDASGPNSSTNISTSCLPLRSEDDEMSSQPPLNLDITALFAYVSNLTNGHAQYRFREHLLDEQAAWERERPALPALKNLIDCRVGGIKKRELICCRTAYDAFLDILSTVGGGEEKARSDMLLKRIRVVEDRMSDRAAGLRLSGKIKERSRVIFGTGDYYRAITVTANKGFVFAAGNQGVRFVVILHESRALSEQKQHHAVPLPGSAPSSNCRGKEDSSCATDNR